MSKERALLKEVLYVIGEYTEDAQERTEILIAEIEKLLAQPEQEPVAWMYEWVNEIGEHVKSVVYNFYDDANLIPLYLAPPKREPLINIYVLNAFKADDEATHPYSYWAGVEFAEKHHGIGGNNDN